MRAMISGQNWVSVTCASIIDQKIVFVALRLLGRVRRMSRVSVLDVISSSSQKLQAIFPAWIAFSVRDNGSGVSSQRTSSGERASTSGIYKVMQLVPLA